MLASAATIEMVAEALKERTGTKIVVDPVCPIRLRMKRRLRLTASTR